VLLGTGYRVDIVRYPFLSPRLTAAVHQVSGYPVLRSGLESSVPGLHFLGAPAAWSFGPLMRLSPGVNSWRCSSPGTSSAGHGGDPVGNRRGCDGSAVARRGRDRR
jgi:hypothetical protein